MNDKMEFTYENFVSVKNQSGQIEWYEFVDSEGNRDFVTHYSESEVDSIVEGKSAPVGYTL